MHPFLKDRPIVPPTGPKNTRIMIVGEQPGIEEARNGRPFVGPAGRELDIELRMAGIPRQECYLTNTFKDLSHPLNYYMKIPSKATQSVVISEEGQQYIEALKQEIEEVAPNIVICVGGVATYAITSRRGIYKWRGSVVESTLVPGQKCIPTLHSATVIPPKNVFLNRYLIAGDLKKALQESYTNKITYESRVRRIELGFWEFMSFLNECVKYGLQGAIIDIDIEIVNEELSCISFAYNPYISISIPFFGPQGNYFNPEQEASIMLKIAEIYENPGISIRGQNHIFDANFMLGKYGIKFQGEFHDTMIGQKILYPDFKADLGFITTMYTDIPYYKDDGKKWMKVGGPWEEFWVYNCNDSLVTAEAGPKQLQQLEDMDNMEVYNRQCRIVEPLLYMQERGIKVDVEGMANEKERTKKIISEKEKELWELVGYPINYNSPKQIMTYFYDELSIKPYFKKGKKTTDENALKRIAKGTTARKPYPEAQLILDLRGLGKRSSTYLELGKVDKDGRYRSAYKPVGTKTGRLASGETIFGTGGNQQNWPHDLLRFLTFDSGYIGYSIDLSQAENRIVAYVGNIPEIMKAFETGVDCHALTASFILGKPIKEISNNDGSSDFGNGRQSERYWGKKCNHELNYDMGYKKFALEYELSERDAKFMVGKFHEAYPGIKNNYHRGIREQLYKDRTITNLMGRKRIFLGDIEDVTFGGKAETFRQAYNHLPQSTVADIINERGINYIYYNQDLFKYVELLTQIHDSIVFQIPLNQPFKYHAQCVKSICQSLETPLTYHDRTWVIPADVSIGLNMGKKDQIELSNASQMEVNKLADKLKEVYMEF